MKNHSSGKTDNYTRFALLPYLKSESDQWEGGVCFYIRKAGK